MRLLSAIAFLALATPAFAQDREVPYWATLRAEVVNMRVGPSEAYPIEWVYRRQGLPVKRRTPSAPRASATLGPPSSYFYPKTRRP